MISSSALLRTTTMATVHPSRLNLIPENLRPQNNSKDLSRNSPPRHRYSRSQSPQRYSRDRARKTGGYHGRDRYRSRSRDLDKRGNERREYGSRRTSPKYDDYRPTPEAPINPGSQRRMYPERGGGGRYGGHFTGNADYLARWVYFRLYFWTIAHFGVVGANNERVQK